MLSYPGVTGVTDMRYIFESGDASCMMPTRLSMEEIIAELESHCMPLEPSITYTLSGLV